ncbi:hypothetical protein PtA15_5A819 [Puccinia triticina]|uniref:Uncharacterized protein n=1 Tax=Puccinia triticina TaxID=208348 RepID=A0ABY7CKL5_9BASI|nr:uncharacterized protein PtA15_5A819 [Puccinia triticina]WAQ85245.1 hypothetical protein PtA15_5A819 [Puccinia triticina]
MLLNSTNITHQRSNHIITTSCSSIPVTRQSSRSSSAESPLDAPKSPFRAEIDTRRMQSPCPVSPPSGGSSNWSSPSTCIFSSPLRPEEPCGVSSKITFDLGEMIDEAFFCSLLPPKPRLSVDVSSYKHILGEVEEEEAPHSTPLTAPRYTSDYAKVVDAQGSADPAAVENPIIRCLPDLHLLQTPLREAFREVFDYLSDETPDYAEQQTQHPYGTVNCTRGNLAAPLSCDSTDLNSNISESDGKSSAALNPRPESCLPSLENGPPLIPLPTPPCNLKRLKGLHQAEGAFVGKLCLRSRVYTSDKTLQVLERHPRRPSLA